MGRGLWGVYRGWAEVREGLQGPYRAGEGRGGSIGALSGLYRVCVGLGQGKGGSGGLLGVWGLLGGLYGAG